MSEYINEGSIEHDINISCEQLNALQIILS